MKKMPVSGRMLKAEAHPKTGKTLCFFKLFL
jgi:hypothetical protein